MFADPDIHSWHASRVMKIFDAQFRRKHPTPDTTPKLKQVTKFFIL